ISLRMESSSSATRMVAIFSGPAPVKIEKQPERHNGSHQIRHKGNGQKKTRVVLCGNRIHNYIDQADQSQKEEEPPAVEKLPHDALIQVATSGSPARVTADGMRPVNRPMERTQRLRVLPPPRRRIACRQGL